MSRIAIVDEKDNYIGDEERAIVYQKGLIHRLVRVFLINDKNQILLQYRSKDEDTFPETWDQSAGGHVDANEDYEIAAQRELEEELGVKDINLELVDKFYTPGTIGLKIINRFNAVFIAKCNQEDFKLQIEEVEKVQWFDFEDLKKQIIVNPTSFTTGLKFIIEKYGDKLLAR